MGKGQTKGWGQGLTLQSFHQNQNVLMLEAVKNSMTENAANGERLLRTMCVDKFICHKQ